LTFSLFDFFVFFSLSFFAFYLDFKFCLRCFFFRPIFSLFSFQAGFRRRVRRLKPAVHGVCFFTGYFLKKIVLIVLIRILRHVENLYKMRVLFWLFFLNFFTSLMHLK